MCNIIINNVLHSFQNPVGEKIEVMSQGQPRWKKNISSRKKINHI